MVLPVTQSAETCRFSVKVTPKAKQNRLGLVHDGRLKVYVTAAPEGGQANRAVCHLLAGNLKLPAAAVEIVSGQTMSRKVVEVRGVAKQVLETLGRPITKQTQPLL